MSTPETPCPCLPGSQPSCRRGLKALPALGAIMALGLALLAAPSLLPPAEQATASAAEKQVAEAVAQVKDAVAAGKKFLETLDASQRSRALLDFSSPKKAGWSNLPVTFVPRNGVRLGDLTQQQREAAMALLAVVLSKDGYQKIVNIMDGDQQLVKGGGKGGKGKGKGGKGGPNFGKDQYYLALFGEPSATKPWMVQFGGHHLGLNVTLVEKSLVLTPTHTGAQPTTFTRDGQTVRPLGVENDRGFDLVASLNEQQRAQAVQGNRPINLQLGPGQDNKRIEPRGIRGSDLTEAQRGVLLELIAAWVSILPEDAASPRLAQLKAKLPETYFAWYGPTARGSAAYFRVQGPTVVIEYAPQGGIDHIHTIVRDPTDDYGRKLIQ
jgi:hypothetical protein